MHSPDANRARVMLALDVKIMNKLDILFIVCLLALYFLPKESKRFNHYWIISLTIFSVGIGIRIHSKITSHKSSEKIHSLNQQVTTLQKDLKGKEQKISEITQKNKELVIRQKQHSLEISNAKKKEKINTFKALEANLMKDIIHQLSEIKRKDDLDFHISIYYLSHSDNRMKVGKELESMLKESGFSTYSNDMLRTGRPVDILLECSNSNLESFKEVLEVLQKMLIVVFDWKETKDEKEVKFIIMGTPQFKDNGVVYFKEK